MAKKESVKDEKFVSDIQDNVFTNDEFFNESLKKIETDNNYMVCRKVIYGVPSKIDPDDTSHIYYEVLVENPNSKWCPGDLIKFHGRFYEEQELFGHPVILIDYKLVQLGIKKENL